MEGKCDTKSNRRTYAIPKKLYLSEILRYTTHMKRMKGSWQFKRNGEVVILRDVRSAADKLSAFTSVDNWSQAILTELPLRVLS